VAGFARETVVVTFPLPRSFLVLAIVWVAAMTWRLYPDFKDSLRIDGRLATLTDYIEDSCGQRIGPSAATCLEEARSTGRRLVACEQGKAILLIEAPILGYLFVYLPLHLLAGRIGRWRLHSE
jgi:hypothetical protein